MNGYLMAVGREDAWWGTCSDIKCVDYGGRRCGVNVHVSP